VIITPVTELLTRQECHVYLIEDDGDLREQLVATLIRLGLIVHDYSTAEQFLISGIDHSPSVIVTDMVLPGISGIRLLEAIREADIETPLIFISGYSEPNQIIQGMKLGAVDFLWKPFKTDALLDAVTNGLNIDEERQKRMVQTTGAAQRWVALSEREKEVCLLMLKGFGNKDISLQLGIQPDTANKHRMKILKKMGVAGRPQLIELLKGLSSSDNGKAVDN
jgi:FixJ family two-component response regulator